MIQGSLARLAVEEGMGAFQGRFPRLKDRFFYEERSDRKIVLMITVLLFHMRAAIVRFD